MNYSAAVLVARARRSRLATALGAAAIVYGSFSISAQGLWWQDYKDGVTAFNNGDDARAEQKILAALNNRAAPASRSRSVPYVSQQRGEFLPEYYLARIYAKQRRYAEALRYARIAEAYMRNDKDYPTLTAVKAEAERALNPPRPPTPAPTPAPTAAPPPVTPPPGPTPEPRAAAGREIDDLTNQISAKLVAKDWTSAKSLVDRLASLRPDTDSAAARLVRDAPAQIARGIAQDDAVRQERAGLDAFFRGNYLNALAALNRVPPGLTTPRIFFYKACSNAALGLLDGDKGKPLIQRARDLFRQSQPRQNRFETDRQYISPGIIAALEGASR